MTDKQDNHGISRRGLLKTAFVGASAAGLMGTIGISRVKAATGDEATADAVIIGAGYAGLTAAIRMLKLGSKVIVLEKQKWPPFSNSARAFGSTYCFNSGVHRAKGLAKTNEELYQDIRKYLPLGDPDLQKAWSENIGDAVDMLTEVGVRAIINDMPYDRKGLAISPKTFFEAVTPAIKAAGGVILDETRADKILVDEDGAVIGIKARNKDGKSFKIKSEKAVIVGSGGFQLNPELVTRYVGPGADTMIPLLRYGFGGTGDGLIMCTEIGAGTSLGMNTWYGHLVFLDEKGDRPKAFHFTSNGSLKFDVLGVVVNIFGKRYTDESGSSETIAQDSFYQPESALPPFGKAFVIIDQKIYDSRKMDFESAQKAVSVIAKADTLEELGNKVKAWGVDGQTMVETVKQFNEAVAQKKTNELCPPKCTMMEAGYVYDLPLIGAIDKGPFYAIPTKPAMTFTEGGLRVNPDCAVLDRSGLPIPRLYASGDATGGFCNRNYVAGTGVGKAIVSGFIAGAKAHALTKIGA